MSKVLDNHRQLGPDEVIRRGDFYKEIATGKINPVKHSIGNTPQKYLLDYNFYRRRHTKKVVPAPRRTIVTNFGRPGATVVSTPASKPANTPRFPEVEFSYPSTRKWGAPEQRHVKVISLDDTYLVGLEVQSDGGHQFKRYLVNRVRGDIQLIKF